MFPRINVFLSGKWWITSEVMDKWLNHFTGFAKPSPEKSLASHKHLNVLQKTKRVWIILFCFPAHCAYVKHLILVSLDHWKSSIINKSDFGVNRIPSVPMFLRIVYLLLLKSLISRNRQEQIASFICNHNRVGISKYSWAISNQKSISKLIRFGF